MTTTQIQTRPEKPVGTVMIIQDGEKIVEVISDLQLDVKVVQADRHIGDPGLLNGFALAVGSFPSRPLWQFVAAAGVKAMSR